MGPRRPEVEFVDLRKVQQCACTPSPSPDMAAGLQELKQLANGALKKGPFSITTDKQPPHVAASNDIHDFLSYAPYFWPSDSGDGKYVRRDGKRNPGRKHQMGDFF
ncbi:hypothetical protein BC940DRAFT_292363 [Gongronella butleri]|nr:hypothetical protein BC940DRAFT_292363 [Gongronella butleri]